MPEHSRPGLGIVLILSAGLLLSTQDALAKTLSASYPLLLVVWFRYLSQNLVMAALFAPRLGWGLLRTQRPLLQLARGLSLVGVTLLFYAGLRYIPLGEATAVIFLAPLVVVVLSVLWLKEAISRGVWLSMAGSMLGVLLIVRPGGELFTPAALLPLAAACCFGLYQLLTRRLSTTDHPATSNFLTALIGTLCASLALPWTWQTPQPADLLMMVALGTLAMSGHMLLTHAYRYASAASLAPFTYGQILTATLIGALVFDHLPGAWAVLGMAVIILSGAALAWSQRRPARTPL
ncbi:DMT family transporter [Pseudomonas sp. PDM14]|uniref:DMT family transporter n=1 Tax=Pseudomonas sp. PDM14 TaxID=2769288 RepID=UPI0017824184|nr:DMT family transporter [Pseudomonas sp. PDM14]MBD9485503.1 DMT family transporter [Pseudomonas sp. PDM14]